VWRNMNTPYTNAMKRDMSVADFTGTTNGFNDNGMMADWNHFGMLVGYQESHDEERINYEGQWDYTGAEIDFATRMERAKINAAFFLLSPGPKMIWQYGELGYDYSLFYDRDSGTVIKDDGTKMKKKPYVAETHLAVKERKALYDTYSRLLAFRRKNHRCFDSDVNFRWSVGSSNQVGRYAYVKDGDGRQFVLFGNFGKGTQTISVTLPSGGDWYQYDNPAAVWSGSSHSTSMSEGQFYILVSDKSMCL